MTSAQPVEDRRLGFEAANTYMLKEHTIKPGAAGDLACPRSCFHNPSEVGLPFHLAYTRQSYHANGSPIFSPQPRPQEGATRQCPAVDGRDSRNYPCSMGTLLLWVSVFLSMLHLMPIVGLYEHRANIYLPAGLLGHATLLISLAYRSALAISKSSSESLHTLSYVLSIHAHHFRGLECEWD